MSTSNEEKRSRAVATLVWLASNLPIILTVLAATILTILAGVVELSAVQLLQMTLGLLVGIALSLLTERYVDSRQTRHRQESIAETVLRIEGALDGSGQTLDSLVVTNSALPRLEDRFEGAKRISISGGSLTRLATEYHHKFVELVNKGCEIRLLMVDPDKVGAEQLHSAAVYGGPSLEDYRQQIARAIKSLQIIEPAPPGKLEIRVASFAPPFSLVVIEHFDGRAIIQLQVYPFQTPARDRPTWIIDATIDPELHTLFGSQFDRMLDSDLTSTPTG
jgi:hypothetical protein